MQWWRQIVDRHEILLFRRVQAVELTGEQFTREHLQKVSAFTQLKMLVLNGTSISSRELGEWHQAHPQVEVRMNTANGLITLAAR
jgi:hypothetical protein